jgi:cytochrome c553
VKQRVGAVVLGVACFALGAASQRVYDAYRSPVPQTAETATPPTIVTSNTELQQGVAKATPKFELEPLWAYGFETPPAPGEKAAPQNPPTRNLRPNEDATEQTKPRRLEGSDATYSLVDIRDGGNVIDWFPGDHPMPMPRVIKHGPSRGKGTTARGCASCHLPTGRGRPENAQPGGLPVTYAMAQINDFRNGLRRTADPRKPNTNTMIELAKAMTDEEVQEAAEYFAAVKWIPWVRVVETDLVPKTRISGNLFVAKDHGLTEPIAGRIIEVPENEELAETLRSPRSGFVAYVPKGSLEKGKDLVLMGGMKIVDDKIVQGKTTACGTCHGPDLMGVADIPPIAGRSPSYMVRQMWDMQQGTRNGASAQLMKLVIANLTPDDMVAIAAYVASRFPPTAVSPTMQVTANTQH